MQVLPGCLLLHFAAADLQEGEGDVDAARQVYQDLLPSLVPDETPPTPAPQVPAVSCLCTICEALCKIPGTASVVLGDQNLSSRQQLPNCSCSAQLV